MEEFSNAEYTSTWRSVNNYSYELSFLTYKKPRVLLTVMMLEPSITDTDLRKENSKLFALSF